MNWNVVDYLLYRNSKQLACLFVCLCVCVNVVFNLIIQVYMFVFFS